MYLNITLSNDAVFNIPPLNISHSYPVPQPVTKTIIEDGYHWLDHVKKLEKDNLEDGEWISWAAYHASITEPQTEFGEDSFPVIPGQMHTEKRGQPATMHNHPAHPCDRNFSGCILPWTLTFCFLGNIPHWNYTLCFIVMVQQLSSTVFPISPILMSIMAPSRPYWIWFFRAQPSLKPHMLLYT